MATHLANIFLRQLQELVHLVDRIFGSSQGLIFLDWVLFGKRLFVYCLTLLLGWSTELGSWLFVWQILLKGWLLFEIILLFLYSFWRELKCRYLTINLERGGFIINIFSLFHFRLLYFTTSLTHIPLFRLFINFILTKMYRNCGRIKISLWGLSWYIRIGSLSAVRIFLHGSHLGCDCRKVLVPSVSFCVGLNHIQT